MGYKQLEKTTIDLLRAQNHSFVVGEISTAEKNIDGYFVKSVYGMPIKVAVECKAYNHNLIAYWTP